MALEGWGKPGFPLDGVQVLLGDTSADTGADEGRGCFLPPLLKFGYRPLRWWANLLVARPRLGQLLAPQAILGVFFRVIFEAGGDPVEVTFDLVECPRRGVRPPGPFHRLGDRGPKQRLALLEFLHLGDGTAQLGAGVGWASAWPTHLLS